MHRTHHTDSVTNPVWVGQRLVHAPMRISPGFGRGFPFVLASESMKTLDSPHPVDIHVGCRVRSRRMMLGMTQSELAGQFGLTFQQLQKYESGANRISASRLWEIAKILNVPVAWFFEDLEDNTLSAEEFPDTKVFEIAQMVQALPTKIQRPVLLAFKSLAVHSKS